MKPIFDIRLEIVRLIEARLRHFCSFRRAAEHKGNHSNKKHLRQFKTEKWLQAELVHHFWFKQIPVTPEYSEEKWDLCIERPNGQGDFLLAIKCLADSGQCASSDFRGVQKDLEAVGKLHSTQGALLLILPLDENDRRRRNYAARMLECTEHHDPHNLIVKKDKILFAPSGDEGVWVVWVEPRRYREGSVR